MTEQVSVPQSRIPIGVRIERLRLRINKTQMDVAEAIGVKRVTVTQWESGTRKVKPEMIVALAQYFNVTSDYLLGLSDVKNTDPEQKSRIDKMTEKIADYYGIESQKNQLVEEMAELTQAIIKLWRYKNGVLYKKITEKELLTNMVGEMADVRLVLNQLIYLMDAAAEVQDVVEHKVNREMDRIVDAPVTRKLKQEQDSITMQEEMGDVECE